MLKIDREICKLSRLEPVSMAEADMKERADLQQLISLPGETRAQQLAREYARVGTMMDIMGG